MPLMMLYNRFRIEAIDDSLIYYPYSVLKVLIWSVVLLLFLRTRVQSLRLGSGPKVHPPSLKLRRIVGRKNRLGGLITTKVVR